MAAMYTLRDSSLQIEDHADFLANKAAFDKTTWLYHEPTGLLTNKVYADGNGTAYSYTPDGKLATRTWARGITTSYEYAPCCGSLTAILYSDGTPGVTNQYDRLGRQVGVVDASGQRTFAYNDLLQLAAETNAMAVVERRYDALGRDSGFEVGRGVPAEPSPYAVAYS
jgi:YD repeat-containing protein